MEESRRSRIVELISTKYCDFQPSLICKYLLRDEGIDVSEEFIRRIVKAQDPVTRDVLLEEAHPSDVAGTALASIFKSMEVLIIGLAIRKKPAVYWPLY